jgi:hypothetical protein
VPFTFGIYTGSHAVALGVLFASPSSIYVRKLVYFTIHVPCICVLAVRLIEKDEPAEKGCKYYEETSEFQKAHAAQEKFVSSFALFLFAVVDATFGFVVYSDVADTEHVFTPLKRAEAIQGEALETATASLLVLTPDDCRHLAARILTQETLSKLFPA